MAIVGENVWSVCKSRHNNPVGLLGLRIKHPPSGVEFECEGYWWGPGGAAKGDLRIWGFGHLDWNDETCWPMIRERPHKGYPAIECILVSEWKVPSPKYRLRKTGGQ